MSSEYTEVSSGGSVGDANAYVRLYPNTIDEDGNVISGTYITDAISWAMDQLINYGAIDHYKVLKYSIEDHPYITDASNLSSSFPDWLKDGTNSSGNSSGKDLLSSYKGVHLCVHDLGCDTTGASAQYADDCSDPDHYDAFSAGVAAWSGVCTNTGLRKNSAIQEPLHCFIRYKDSDVSSLFGDCSSGSDNNDEHTLGEIKNNNISPMITYHTGECDGVGDCNGDGSSPVGYTQNLTGCTKEAIQRIANDQCQNR